MSNTDCCGASAKATSAPCPSCGAPGASVPNATVEGLCTDATPLPEDRWRACGSAACPVVWYGEATGTALDTRACRVRVTAKETAADRPVCYCFAFSAEVVIARAGSSEPVSVVVREACRRGEDRCETTNPRGACCLGEIRRIEKAAGHIAVAASGS